jgi:L-amino acid N-acyltransferase YncA
VSQYPVVAIGAIGTKKGYEGRGYMSEALKFLIDEYSGKENALAIVAHTKDPESRLWVDNGFKQTSTMPSAGNALVAFALRNEEFDVNSSYEVPFHF